MERDERGFFLLLFFRGVSGKCPSLLGILVLLNNNYISRTKEEEKKEKKREKERKGVRRRMKAQKAISFIRYSATTHIISTEYNYKYVQVKHSLTQSPFFPLCFFVLFGGGRELGF